MTMSIQDYIDKKLVHSLHTSVRKSFRSCRRRWDWAYREKYYPKITAPPLEFGVAFHAAMEEFYNPAMWTRDPAIRQGLALVKFKQICEDQLKNYAKLNGEPEKRVIDEYQDRIKLGLNMIRHYTNNVSPLSDVGFTPIEVEVPFEIPITNPDTSEVLRCKCDDCWKKYTNSSLYNRAWIKEDIFSSWLGLPVTYGGRLDMLAKDELGRYWIYDWKTTSRMLNEDSESAFLALDDQIGSYVWALRLLGLPVAGFIYVEIKKDYPTTPDELSRLYRGRRYSTSKTAMSTEEIYRNWVMEHDAMAYAEGLYDDHIKWLKNEGPRFHQRHQIHKNDHECDQVGRDIYYEACDIIGQPHVYPMPGRFTCRNCLYRQPCIGKNQGEDYQYTLDTLFEHRDYNYYDQAPTTE